MSNLSSHSDSVSILLDGKKNQWIKIEIKLWGRKSKKRKREKKKKKKREMKNEKEKIQKQYTIRKRYNGWRRKEMRQRKNRR